MDQLKVQENPPIYKGTDFHLGCKGDYWEEKKLFYKGS